MSESKIMSAIILWNNVLVKGEKKEKNKNGIILATSNNPDTLIEAEIVSFGDKVENEDIKQGRIAGFKKFACLEIEIDDNNYMLVKDADILYVKA